MLFRIEENENGSYVKDDKSYDLQSCNEFVPAKDKTISDYGWVKLSKIEEAIKYFNLQEK